VREEREGCSKPEAKDPRVGGGEGGEEAVEEEEDAGDDERLLPAEPVRDLPPEGGADHHPCKIK
jgi:hypothetical protein